MNQIAALRDTLGNVYRRQDYWLLPLFRALTALVLFMTLRAHLGYSSLCAGIPVILAASLFCAFLPWAGIPFLGAALVLGNLYSASLELTLVGGLVFLMAALVQSAFRARGAVLLALLPFFISCTFPMCWCWRRDLPWESWASSPLRWARWCIISCITQRKM